MRENRIAQYAPANLLATDIGRGFIACDITEQIICEPSGMYRQRPDFSFVHLRIDGIDAEKLLLYRIRCGQVFLTILRLRDGFVLLDQRQPVFFHVANDLFFAAADAHLIAIVRVSGVRVLNHVDRGVLFEQFLVFGFLAFLGLDFRVFAGSNGVVDIPLVLCRCQRDFVHVHAVDIRPVIDFRHQPDRDFSFQQNAVCQHFPFAPRVDWMFERQFAELSGLEVKHGILIEQRTNKPDICRVDLVLCICINIRHSTTSNASSVSRPPSLHASAIPSRHRHTSRHSWYSRKAGAKATRRPLRLTAAAPCCPSLHRL